jgi:hypothetical protein
MLAWEWGVFAAGALVGFILAVAIGTAASVAGARRGGLDDGLPPLPPPSDDFKTLDDIPPAPPPDARPRSQPPEKGDPL